MSSSSILWRVIPSRHSSIGRSGTLNSRLKKLVTSVPSSGRPTWDMTPRTSGTEAMTSRSLGAIRAASSRETVRGIRARIQRLPSSSSGMNSAPSPGSSAIVKASRPPIEKQRRQAEAEDVVQDAAVDPLHRPVNERLLLLRLVVEQERAEDRGERHRQEECPEDGEGIGRGHRPEEGARGAAHGEERQEGADDDQRREEERPLDLVRGVGDPVDERAGAVGAVLGDVPVDRLDDDDRAIDDDSEIDRPDGEQVRRLALDVEDGDRVEQGQRDDQRDDGGTRQVAEEDEEHGDDQADADEQVVEHVVRRDVDEVRPLVEDRESSSPWAEAFSCSISAIFSATASAVGRDFSYFRISTMPSTTSSSSPRPTIPWRGLCPTITWATCRT